MTTNLVSRVVDHRLFPIVIALSVGLLSLVGLVSYIKNESVPYLISNSLRQQAVAVCEETFRARVPSPPLAADATFDERADRVLALADDQESLIARLQLLDGVASEPGMVEWLDDYAKLVAIGREYAAAVRTGDPERYKPAGNKGDEPQTRLMGDARFHGLEACVAWN